MDQKQPLNTPIARLHRATDRGTHVWETHRATDPSLDAHGAAMVEARERFNLSQQALILREGQLADARLQLTDSIRVLQRAKRGCLAEATLSLADFDTSGLTGSDVAEDALAESRLVYGRVEARAGDTEAAPRMQLHLTTLATAIAAVDGALAAFNAAGSAVQTARDERYTAAVRLDDRLIAFRRTVRSVLGSTHRDYRGLRARAGRGALEGDLELDAPAAEPPVQEPEQASVPDAAALPVSPPVTDAA